MSVQFAFETAAKQAVRHCLIVWVLAISRGLLKSLDATTRNTSCHTYSADSQELHKTPVDKLPFVQL